MVRTLRLELRGPLIPAVDYNGAIYKLSRFLTTNFKSLAKKKTVSLSVWYSVKNGGRAMATARPEFSPCRHQRVAADFAPWQSDALVPCLLCDVLLEVTVRNYRRFNHPDVLEPDICN